MSQTTTDQLREILTDMLEAYSVVIDMYEENPEDLDTALHRLTALLATERLDGIKQPILKYNMTTAIAVKDLCDERIEQLKKASGDMINEN